MSHERCIFAVKARTSLSHTRGSLNLAPAAKWDLPGTKVVSPMYAPWGQLKNGWQGQAQIRQGATSWLNMQTTMLFQLISSKPKTRAGIFLTPKIRLCAYLTQKAGAHFRLGRRLGVLPVFFVSAPQSLPCLRLPVHEYLHQWGPFHPRLQL